MKLGFEIEIEDVTSTFTETPGIMETTDGSLRNGKEYVSSVLPNPQYALMLYTYMFDTLEGNYSERCGFHFHLDLTSRSKAQILSFVKSYILVERTLFRTYPNILRSNNNFCNLLVDSQDELNLIRRYAHESRNPFSDYSKYTALNLKPMTTIGTVEFRAAVAGLTPEDFGNLLTIFSHLYEGSIPEHLNSQITAADRAEADALIDLINTPITSSPDLGDYMSEHFDVPSAPTNVLTKEMILNYLRG